MPTALRFPVELNPPDRVGYSEEFRTNQRRHAMEIGVPRRRRTHANLPTIILAEWTMTLADYAFFDRWFQDIINGGDLPFDLEIDDGAGGLVWQTVRSYERWQATRPKGRANWIVSWKLRTIGDRFADRPLGTDELNARNTITHIGRGALSRLTYLYGRATHTHFGEGYTPVTPPVELAGVGGHNHTGRGVFRNWNMNGRAEHTHVGVGQLAEL